MLSGSGDAVLYICLLACSHGTKKNLNLGAMQNMGQRKLGNIGAMQNLALHVYTFHKTCNNH